MLQLEWTDTKIRSIHEQSAIREILPLLQPHKNWRELTLMNCRGDIFPSWLSRLAVPPYWNMKVGLSHIDKFQGFEYVYKLVNYPICC